MAVPGQARVQLLGAPVGGPGACPALGAWGPRVHPGSWSCSSAGHLESDTPGPLGLSGRQQPAPVLSQPGAGSPAARGWGGDGGGARWAWGPALREACCWFQGGMDLGTSEPHAQRCDGDSRGPTRGQGAVSADAEGAMPPAHPSPSLLGPATTPATGRCTPRRPGPCCGAARAGAGSRAPRAASPVSVPAPHAASCDAEPPPKRLCVRTLSPPPHPPAAEGRSPPRPVPGETCPRKGSDIQGHTFRWHVTAGCEDKVTPEKRNQDVPCAGAGGARRGAGPSAGQGARHHPEGPRAPLSPTWGQGPGV